MFTAAAAKIHNTEKIKARLNAQRIFIEGNERIENFKEYTGVIFPVLSRNTAAKGEQPNPRWICSRVNDRCSYAGNTLLLQKMQQM